MGWFAWGAAALALLGGCSAAPTDGGKTPAAAFDGVVRYALPGGAHVTWDEAYLGANLREAFQGRDEQVFREVVSNALMAEATFEESMQMGLATAPAVEGEVNKLKFKHLSSLYLTREVAEKIEITEEEYAAAYPTEPKRAVEIRVLAPARVEDVAAIHLAAGQGKTFDELVEQYGSDNTKQRQAYFGWVYDDSPMVPAEERERVFGTPAGAMVDGPVQMLTGPVFVQVAQNKTKEDFAEAMREQVDPELRRWKFTERYPALVAELEKEIPVEILADFEDYDRGLMANDGVVAMVGPYRLFDQPAGHGGAEDRSPEAMAKLRESLRVRVQQALIATKAEMMGLDADPSYQELLRPLLRKALWTARKNHEYRKPVSFTEEDLRRYFEESRDTQFWRRPHIDAGRFHPFAEGEVAGALAQVAAVRNSIEGEEYAKANGRTFEMKHLLAIEDMSPEMREAQEGKGFREVFFLREGDAWAIYQVAKRSDEDHRPAFEEVRDQVAEAYTQYLQAKQLNEFVQAHLARVEWNDAAATAVYAKATEGMKKGHGQPASGQKPPGHPGG